MNLDILSREDLTVKEIAEQLNCSTATVCRKRKQLGISAKRGCKPGASKPEKLKQENRLCLRCRCEFKTIPSNKKKYCSLSCSTKSIDKSYMQTESYRSIVSKDTTPAYKRYASLVHRLTRKVYDEHKDIINPNDYPRTVCGVDGGWQLDHIITIKEGFQNQIPADEIACLDNLRMLPWKQNLMRNYEHTV